MVKVEVINQIKIRDVFLNALNGGFMNKDYYTLKKNSSNLRIFVSSTFTDTHDERNILLNQILPKLKEYIKQIDSDINLIFVDMRYGVKNESGNHHKTWMVCRAELERCRDESAGIFFLSLQSNKYGYRSLPKFINKKNVDECLVKYLDISDKDELLEIFYNWYILDENSIIPMYSLKSLTKDNTNEFWNKVLPNLLKLLNGCEFGGNGDDIEKDLYAVGESVTHYETAGAFKDSDSCKRSIWWHRQFSSPITIDQDPLHLFDDNTDHTLHPSYKNLKIQLNDMKDMMKNNIPQDNIYSHTIESSVLQTIKTGNKDKNGNYQTITKLFDCNKKDNYLAKFEETIYNTIKNDIDRVHDYNINFSKNAYCSGMPGNDALEMMHHLQLARNKVAVFHGRIDLIQKGLSLCKGEETKILDIKTKKKKTLKKEKNIKIEKTKSEYDCISFYITGKSGTGKTSLIAKIASDLFKIEESKGEKSRPVIIRFCGTSVESNNGLNLVISICKQIHFLVYGTIHMNVSLDYKSIVDYLHQLLNENPIILLIDSIDQLTNDNKERSELSFLKGLIPHKDTRIIISCLPDEKDLITNKVIYWYGCQTLLINNNATSLEVKLIGQSGDINEISDMLDIILLEYGRKLTNIQKDYVLIHAKNESTALYINFVVRIVSQWKSTDTPIDLNCYIQNSVNLIINQIFDSLKLEYGPKLVKAAIAFITLSLNGVSDLEIEDLLSLDEEVMKEINEYNQSSRLNSHVWLRLRSEINDLIIVTSNNCIKWYHRQLSETAMNIFTQDQKEYYHQIMGKFFGNIVDHNIILSTKIQLNPLLLKNEMKSIWIASNHNINKRRCSESSYNLVNGKLYKEAINELCDLEVICCCIKVNEGYTLLNCFIKLLQLFNDNNITSNHASIEYTKLLHYYKWFKSSITEMIKYDSQILAITATCTTTQPMNSIARRDIAKLINHSDHFSFNDINMNNKENIYYQCKSLGGYDDFTSLQMTLNSHTDSVESVSISKDGSRFVSGSKDKTVKIWNSLSGECILTLLGHTSQVNFVDFFNNGTSIVSGSGRSNNSCNEIKIWDCLTGVCIQSKSTIEINEIVISNDDKKILFCCFNLNDKTIKIWDNITNTCISTLGGHLGSVCSICFSHDGKRVISGSCDKTIKIWELLTGICISTLEGHSDNITCVAISHNDIIVSGSLFSETIKIWELLTGICIFTLEGHSKPVTTVAISDDGKRAISGSYDEIKIWDCLIGNCIATLKDHNKSINSICIFKDIFITGSDDRSIKIFDHISGPFTSNLQGDTLWIHSVAISIDGNKIVSGGGDEAIKIWDGLTGVLLSTLKGHNYEIKSVAISNNGTRIVSGSSNNTIKIWNSDTGECILDLIGHSKDVNSVVFSHDSSKVISGSQDQTIKIWNSLTGDNILTIKGHTSNVYSVAISNDGNKIISGSRDKTIKIWDSINGECILTLLGHMSMINSVAISNDGNKIISGSYDKTIKIWDSINGECILTLTDHTQIVNAVSFSNDDKKFLSSSNDKTIKIWDNATNTCISTLEGHLDNVNSVCFSHDGKMVISGSSDKTVKCWKANIDATTI